MHEVLHNPEYTEASGEDGERDDEAILIEEGKLKEVTDEGNAIDGSHDANDGKDEGSAEFVERTRQPVDKNEIDSEGDKD